MGQASKSPRNFRMIWAWAQEKGNGPQRPNLLPKILETDQKGHKAHLSFQKNFKKGNGPK